MSELFNIRATGKRKTAIARIYMRPGNGRIVVNQRAFEEYFPMETTRNLARQPLQLVAVDVDILVNVKGGGVVSQAGAIKHGLSRALVVLNPEFRPVLKKAGLLTRDPRVKERKKYGRRGARRGCQYSKR
jgi:small subunit ribosomal protein S9